MGRKSFFSPMEQNIRKKVEHTIFYVINVYSPNDYREQEQFIRILGEKIVSKTDTTKLIISGDWNATPNKIDKWGGLPWK